MKHYILFYSVRRRMLAAKFTTPSKKKKKTFATGHLFDSKKAKKMAF